MTPIPNQFKVKQQAKPKEELTPSECFIITEFLLMMQKSNNYIRKNNEVLLRQLLAEKKRLDISRLIRNNKDKIMVN